VGWAVDLKEKKKGKEKEQRPPRPNRIP